MTGIQPWGPSSDGWKALREGDWSVARARFEALLDGHQDPESFDGLGRALWWMGDVEGAIDAWERAHASYREAGNAEGAARTALFLAAEYAEAVGNEAASNGWLARAQRLTEDETPSSAGGWLLLARAARAADPLAALELSEAALRTARSFADPDLELAALGRCALSKIQVGDVDEGMALFDEAMAAAAGGQAQDLRTLGDLYCCAVTAGEVTLDMSRFGQWTEMVMGFLQRNRHPDLFTFCGTCCAEVVGAAGDLQEVERWLLDTFRTLETTGQRPRCVHPATRLASLRVQQGRFEEAEHFLEGYEDLPEAVQPMVALHLARGQTALAVARLHRRLNDIGRDNLLAVPLLVQLTEAQVLRGDLDAARETSSLLETIAERSGLDRVAAEADLAAGSVGAAADDPEAPTALRRALDAFVRLQMPQAAARSRIALARSLAATDPDTAVEEARQALASFERIGSTSDADMAARFLRGLGVRGRTGPKAYSEVLSKRETEVFRLLGDSLTNAEIAARLYISNKTAATHVGNILSKLGLRNRAEAAVHAQRNLPSESATQ